MNPSRHLRNPQSADWRPRNRQIEAELVDTAARAAGFFDSEGRGDDGGMRAFADKRAHQGGVRRNLDAFQEVAEELADALNYSVWGIEPIWQRVLDGEPEAMDDYSRLLQGLSHLIAAWHAFRTVPS